MSEKQQVVIFRGREVRSGGERYLAETHAYLEREGVKVIPIWLDDLPRWPRRLGLIADCLISNFWLFFQLRRLGDVFGAFFLEDYHLHPRLWLCNELIRLRNGQLVVVVLMQSSLFYHDVLRNSLAHRLDEWVVKRFFSQARIVFCNSLFTRNEIVSFGVPQTRTRVVYCGHEGAVHPYPTHPPTSPDGKNHLLFVGQCASLKGIEYLMQAVSLMDRKDIVVDIVGSTAAEPEYFDLLTKLVAELGLSKRVFFHGHVDNPLQLDFFYQQASIFVLPSRVEGFGIVLLDAMSHGLPIVATRVGSLPELITDGVNGLLVPPADPVALSFAIARLLATPELTEKLAQAGYAFVAEHREFYRWDAVGERILHALTTFHTEGIDQ